MRLPKNFRQIGNIAGMTKIYMEDYVMTYLSAITKDSRTYVRGAILFGTIEQSGSEIYIFVKGAMAAQNIELDLDETVFDDSVWRNIYDVQEQYFADMQVVGWYLCRMGMSTRLNDKIKRTHFENFPGEGKVLYMKDPLEEEEAMYAYRGQDLIKQKGYYVYYVKNEEMQSYMIDEKQEQEAARTYERMLARKKDERLISRSRKNIRKKSEKPAHFVYKAAVAASLMFMIGAAGTFYLYGQAQEKKISVSVFSDKVKSIYQKDDATEETVSAVFPATTAKEKQKKSTTETILHQGEYYIVKRGDTISKISVKIFHSKKYVNKILNENRIKKSQSIYPGQKLKIPQIK